MFVHRDFPGGPQLRLHTPNPGGPDLSPGQGTRPHVTTKSSHAATGRSCTLQRRLKILCATEQTWYRQIKTNAKKKLSIRRNWVSENKTFLRFWTLNIWILNFYILKNLFYILSFIIFHVHAYFYMNIYSHFMMCVLHIINSISINFSQVV